jgi:hypothetical protein
MLTMREITLRFDKVQNAQVEVYYDGLSVKKCVTVTLDSHRIGELRQMVDEAEIMLAQSVGRPDNA